MANYPQELAQDAVCQSHTGHMTGLWFLPARPLRLNTNEWYQYINTMLKPFTALHQITCVWVAPKLQNVAYHWASRCILFDHSLTSSCKPTFPNAWIRRLDPNCLMKPAEETFQRARWWGTHTWSPLKRKLTRFNNKWWERCHTGHSNKITAGCW